MNKFINYRPIFAMVAAILLIIQQPVVAQTTWLGGAGAWDDNSMWSSGVFPLNNYGDKIYYSVFVDGGNGIDSAVLVDRQIWIDSLTIDQGDIVQIFDNSFIDLDPDRGGSLHNDGEIIVLPGGSFRYGALGQNPLVVTGNGTITLVSNVEPGFIRGGSTAGGLRHMINAGSTIQGFGEINGGNGQITNQAGGLIVANIDGETLQVQSVLDGLLNEGTMRATNGGDLRFINVNCTNPNVIEALEDSTVTLAAGADITSGTIRSIGSGSVEVMGSSSGPSITDLTLQGTVNLYDSNFFVTGEIENQAEFSVFGGGQLRNNDVTTFSGGGSILLDSSNGLSEIDGSNGEFTNLDNLIHGFGRIAVGSFCNQPEGIVDADVAGQSILFIGGATPYINLGVWRASNGGDLELQSRPIENFGATIEATAGSTITLKATAISGGTVRSIGSGSIEIENVGTTFTDLSVGGTVNVPSGQLHLIGEIENQAQFNVLSNSRVVVNSSATATGSGTFDLASAGSQLSGVGELMIKDGTVTGIGRVAVTTVFDGGTISPGNSIDTLEFRDPTTWVGGTRIEIELGAATGKPGIDWDDVDVGGSHELIFDHPHIGSGVVVELVTLDSKGQPGLLDGFDPTQEYVWQIGKSSFIEGFEPSSFEVDTSNFSNPINGKFSVTVGPSGNQRGLFVRYGQFALGDVNIDGQVNLLDVAPFVDAVNSGNFVSEADINLDGDVNLLDVALFVALLSS